MEENKYTLDEIIAMNERDKEEMEEEIELARGVYRKMCENRDEQSPSQKVMGWQWWNDTYRNWI